MSDPLLRMLAGLAQAEPDRARAARIRARCHTALARSRRYRSPRPDGALRVSEAVVAGLGGGYLAETIRQLFQMYGGL